MQCFRRTADHGVKRINKVGSVILLGLDQSPCLAGSLCRIQINSAVFGGKKAETVFTVQNYIIGSDKNILIDPDAANFATEIAKLKALYQAKFVMTPLDQALDRDGSTPVNILFKPNYYVSGLHQTVLSFNPWIKQTIGWLDANGAAGDFNSAQ